MNNVVVSYENSKEEKRLTSNHARRIEFVTTVHVFDELLKGKRKVLDCAAGTGIYAFYLAEKGYDVTATDITPRHVAYMKQVIKEKNYNVKTAVMDAVDMSRFEDETFDVVLNMGPFYHLMEEEQRQKCLHESIRVLKKGGLLLTAYIPRFYLYQFAAFMNAEYLDEKFYEQIIDTGVLHAEDEKCFWTDTYYASMEEMERLYRQNELLLVDHFAQDGLAPLMKDIVDQWSEEQFQIWCDYHYKVCREKSTLGVSNHVMIVGKKS